MNPRTEAGLFPAISHGLVWLCLSVTLFWGCGEAPSTSPGAQTVPDLYLLNSTGQTLTAVAVGESLSMVGPAIDLGAEFDGDAMDLSPTHAVSTVSSFGGSLTVFVALASGSVVTSTFPGPVGDLTNPSAPTFDATGAVWVGGRGSDAIYRVRPGDLQAEQTAAGVGTFVERVIPVGGRLYAIDANIDDERSTYQPLGPGRVVVLDSTGAVEKAIDLPDGAFNPGDAVATNGYLFVLAAGTFDPGSFEPAGDGALVAIDLTSGTVTLAVGLGGNGIGLEQGADGKLYLVTTLDFVSTRVLRYDPASRSFERGPEDPLIVRDLEGAAIHCWTATGLADGRLLCATFSYAEEGQLVLADDEGTMLDAIPAGFGTTDIALR